EIGVGEQVLGRWVRLARAADDAGNTGAVLDADERAEPERLRRENAELRLAREFLKKSIDGPGWAGAPDEMRIRRWWRWSVLRCCPGRLMLITAAGGVAPAPPGAREPGKKSMARRVVGTRLCCRCARTSDSFDRRPSSG